MDPIAEQIRRDIEIAAGLRTAPMSTTTKALLVVGALGAVGGIVYLATRSRRRRRRRRRR